MVAPAYAVLALAASYAARFDLGLPSFPGVTRATEVTVSVGHVEAFVWPLVIAVIAGALGGLSTAEGTLPHVVATGTRTFAAALVLAFVGLLVVAGLKPQDTRAYIDSTAGGGLKGADGLVHTVLALPNISAWVLAPAMGTCDSVRGRGLSASNRRIDFLCYSKFPANGHLVRAPAAYFLFLLVPIVAVAFGVWTGLGASGSAGLRSTIMLVIGGALVFALLVGVCCALADVGLAGSANAASLRGSADVTVGPQPLTAAGTALAWGLVVGASVAATERTLRRRRQRSAASSS